MIWNESGKNGAQYLQRKKVQRMMDMTSIWMASLDLPHFEPMQGDIKTDVLIIGGGMAGILCAYFLHEKGVDYTLVEGNRICCKITKDTTAKITAQHGFIYDKLVNGAGEEKAKMYLDANLNAVSQYARLAEHIDCDFEQKTSYVYSLNNRGKLEKESGALSRIGFDTDIEENLDLPFPTAGAVAFPNQAQFHPLKFVAQIAKGLRIYENTFVKEWKDHTAVTDHGSIFYQKAIFATHFPIDNKHGMYFLKMYQSRSYVIALQNAPKINGMYVDGEKKGFSFRNYEDFLLIGGGAHRSGKCGGKWEELREFAEKYYPGRQIKYNWATQDCMTLDGVPYIGPYSKHMPDCYVACGFNKWGMTSSMVSAKILTDMATGQSNPYAEVFSPSRSIWKPQLFVNGWEAAVNLLLPAKKRCPHLGCGLKWNKTEETWDCPCHGSRFDEKGILMNNPANKDMKK